MPKEGLLPALDIPCMCPSWGLGGFDSRAPGACLISGCLMSHIVRRLAAGRQGCLRSCDERSEQDVRWRLSQIPIKVSQSAYQTKTREHRHLKSKLFIFFHLLMYYYLIFTTPDPLVSCDRLVFTAVEVIWELSCFTNFWFCLELCFRNQWSTSPSNEAELWAAGKLHSHTSLGFCYKQDFFFSFQTKALRWLWN